MSKKEKAYIDTVKRIMSEKKTTLPSLRNQDWRTVKSETEKVNDLLTNIPTNDTTELNDLIYAGAKLISKKSQATLEDDRQKVKTRVGIQTWITDKKTTTSSKNTKKEHQEFFGRNWKTRQLELKKTLEETNQKS